MRIVVFLSLLCGACASLPARPGASLPARPRVAARAAPQEFNFTNELPQREPMFTIEEDPLPSTFAALSAREREQWHACRPFFMGREPRHCRHGGDPFWCGPLNAEVHVTFGLHAADYVALPDGASRRAMLLRVGCPDAILDLADGSHLDLVESPGDQNGRDGPR